MNRPQYKLLIDYTCPVCGRTKDNILISSYLTMYIAEKCSVCNVNFESRIRTIPVEPPRRLCIDLYQECDNCPSYPNCNDKIHPFFPEAIKIERKEALREKMKLLLQIIEEEIIYED